MLIAIKTIITRHWNGEYSLGFAFWVVGLGATLLLAVIIGGIDSLLSYGMVNVNAYGALLVLIYMLLVVFTIWQLVGIWRSAKYHTSRAGRAGWAVTAQVMVVLACLRAVYDFNQLGLPLMQEGLGLWANGETLGAFELRVLNQGRELELIGDMPYGTTESVQTLLQRYPEIGVIHLNSRGGRMSEGVQLYRLIRQHQLVTYVPSECSSACTLAFMAGSKRYLGKRGILGFHSASIQAVDGDDVAQLNDEFKRIYRQHGVSERFIRDAVRVAGANIWYPGQLELIEARVVDELVQSERFAPSNAFGSVVASWQPEHLQQAPDDELVRYWQVTVDILNYLHHVEPQYCVDYLYPQWASASIDPEAILPLNLLNAHRDAMETLIERTELRTNFSAAVGTAPILLDNVLADIEQREPEFRDVLNRPEDYIQSPLLLCRATVAVYEGALRQSSIGRQAALLRYLQRG